MFCSGGCGGGGGAAAAATAVGGDDLHIYLAVQKFFNNGAFDRKEAGMSQSPHKGT